MQLENQGSNKILISKRSASLYILDCIKSPSLAKISREQTEDFCQAKLTKVLLEFSKFVKTDLNIDDLSDYAFCLMNELPELCFDELIYTLNKVIKGSYGKIYGTWRYNDLREWLNKSYEEFQNEIIKRHNLVKSGQDINYLEMIENREKELKKYGLSENKINKLLHNKNQNK